MRFEVEEEGRKCVLQLRVAVRSCFCLLARASTRRASDLHRLLLLPSRPIIHQPLPLR